MAHIDCVAAKTRRFLNFHRLGMKISRRQSSIGCQNLVFQCSLMDCCSLALCGVKSVAEYFAAFVGEMIQCLCCDLVGVVDEFVGEFDCLVEETDDFVRRIDDFAGGTDDSVEETDFSVEIESLELTVDA